MQTVTFVFVGAGVDVGAGEAVGEPTTADTAGAGIVCSSSLGSSGRGTPSTGTRVSLLLPVGTGVVSFGSWVHS
jgi:hypothetical protein